MKGGSIYIQYFSRKLNHQRQLLGVLSTEAYSEPCQTSKMELFPKLINGCNHGGVLLLERLQAEACSTPLWVQVLTIFAKSSNLDVWQGSEYASDLYQCIKPGKIVFVNALDQTWFSSRKKIGAKKKYWLKAEHPRILKITRDRLTITIFPCSLVTCMLIVFWHKNMFLD